MATCVYRQVASGGTRGLDRAPTERLIELGRRYRQLQVQLATAPGMGNARSAVAAIIAEITAILAERATHREAA